MSLKFSGTDLINLGSAATLDDIANNDGSFLMLVWPNSWPPASAGSFVRKDSGAFIFNATTSILQFTMSRAVQSLNVSAAFADVSTLRANKWCFVGATWDTAGASTQQQLWHGDLINPMTEPALYSPQRTGSGAVVSNDALSVIVGNNVGGTLPFDGRIGFIGAWNRRLDISELRNQQKAVIRYLGYGGEPLLDPSCVHYSFPGLRSLAIAEDLSGNSNHGAITGTQLMADTESLGDFVGQFGWFEAFVASAAAALRRNSSLNGLGASGRFFHDPLAS